MRTNEDKWQDEETWAVFSDGMIYHVVPLEDELEHYLSAECWCCPTVDDDEIDVRVHNAYVAGEIRKAH